MKQLLLLRHAKSSWGDASLADFDRPLAPRGREAAPRMGREIARRGWLPDLALISPAARTRETWALVAAEFPARPKDSFPDGLYAAPAETLLAEIRQTPESVGTLLVIGHNPGLEDLARQIAGDASDAKALARLGEKFPTAALARFKVEGKWAKLAAGGAKLTHFIQAKDLG
jgi:phosphohistidine phosphatase